MNRNIILTEQKLTNIKTKNKYQLEAKQSMLELYLIEKVELLKKLSIDKIQEWDFTREFEIKAKRLHLRDLLEKKVVGLETHRYAPEMNVLHFIGYKFRAMQCTTIEQAINKILLVEDLDKYIGIVEGLETPKKGKNAKK